MEQPPVIVPSSSHQLRTAHGWDWREACEALEVLAKNQEHHVGISCTAMDLGELPNIGLTRYWVSPRSQMQEVKIKLPRIRRGALPCRAGARTNVVVINFSHLAQVWGKRERSHDPVRASTD